MQPQVARVSGQVGTCWSRCASKDDALMVEKLCAVKVDAIANLKGGGESA